MYFHLKENVFLETSDCRIGGCDPAVTFRPQPLSSSELLDAFCVIILLVSLCLTIFPVAPWIFFLG